MSRPDGGPAGGGFEALDPTFSCAAVIGSSSALALAAHASVAPATTRTGDPLGWTDAGSRWARGGARAGASSAFKAPPRNFQLQPCPAGDAAPPPTRYDVPCHWGSPGTAQQQQRRRWHQHSTAGTAGGPLAGRNYCDARGCSAAVPAHAAMQAADISARMCSAVFGGGPSLTSVSQQRQATQSRQQAPGSGCSSGRLQPPPPPAFHPRQAEQSKGKPAAGMANRQQEGGACRVSTSAPCGGCGGGVAVTSAFKSTSDRQASWLLLATGGPGPAYYRPQSPPGRQSFHANLHQGQLGGRLV
jgi:hypothetical protein